MAEKKYERSIELLNKALAMENTASLQYMLFHFICEDRGYRPLAKYFKKTAIDEMRHAEALAERILFLGGEIKMILYKGVKNVNGVSEMLNYSSDLEEETINFYNSAAKETAGLEDLISHKVFQDLLEQEEGHIDQFTLELDNAKEFGDQYLALQVVDNLKHGAE